MKQHQITGEAGGSIEIGTKAGLLKTSSRDCNCTYSVDKYKNSVILGLTLDHRSEGIKATADIAVNPDDARKIANHLLELASEIETNPSS